MNLNKGKRPSLAKLADPKVFINFRGASLTSSVFRARRLIGVFSSVPAFLVYGYAGKLIRNQGAPRPMFLNLLLELYADDFRPRLKPTSLFSPQIETLH